MAIKKNYNVASAYIGKASALRNLNKDSEYLATLQEAMQAAPANATIEKLYAIYYLKEGQAFQKAGNLAKAEESYKHATEVTSKKWKTDALYSLGFCSSITVRLRLKKRLLWLIVMLQNTRLKRNRPVMIFKKRVLI